METKKYSPRLKEKYKKDVVPALQKKFNFTSRMQVPKLLKICVNQGVGDAVADKKLIEGAVKEMSTITGQKAIATYSKKDIANFKLRKGVPIGVRVTLRGDMMYEFLDRLISAALPRIRDFKGINDKSFDGHGNYTLGVTEQIIFPEIDIDKVNKIMGMDITFVTSTENDEEALALLAEYGLPFKNQVKK
jgi:large subunit ribosomal protein L5